MKHLKTYEYFYESDEDTDEDIAYPDYTEGDVVMVEPNNDNENYDDFRNRPLRITHVATNTNQHPGYDDFIKGQGLYDFVDDETGEDIHSSLYDYELVPYKK